MQSPRLATVKTLTQVLRVPEIEVADLRALDAHNAEEVPAGTSNALASRGGTASSATWESSARALL